MTAEEASLESAPQSRRDAETRPEREESILSPVRGSFRLAAYLLLTLVLIPVQAALLASGGGRRLPRWYHRQCCRLLGFKVIRRGRRPLSQRRRAPVRGTSGTLYLANHSSYFDIMALGGLVEASFIAKAEVRGWPLFGLLARLQRTVFVVRRASQVGLHGDEIAERLAAGESLVLFAEGTSNDGNRVLPFKPALLGAVERLTKEGRPPLVQPVSIAYTRLDGLPMGRYFRPFLAWYGDMELLPHLWQALCLGKVTVTVRFHKSLDPRDFASRKELAAFAEERVAAGVAAALTGRALTPLAAIARPDPEEARA